jgi:uncharacterized OsmC-like protein
MTHHALDSVTAAAARPPEPEIQLIDVGHVTDDVYTVDVRGHRFVVDQPAEVGGGDTAPTPTELFVASLATCVAFYSGRYLTRHGLKRTGLRVRTAYTMATDRPAAHRIHHGHRPPRPGGHDRVATIRVAITPPPGLTEKRRAALLAVASHCTVHNSLQQLPDIGIELEQP